MSNGSIRLWGPSKWKSSTTPTTCRSWMPVKPERVLPTGSVQPSIRAAASLMTISPVASSFSPRPWTMRNPMASTKSPSTSYTLIFACSPVPSGLTSFSALKVFPGTVVPNPTVTMRLSRRSSVLKILA